MFSNIVQLLSNSLYLSIIQPGNPETREYFSCSYFFSLPKHFISIHYLASDFCHFQAFC